MPRLKTHPGEILKEEFLLPLGMSATSLATKLGVPVNRLTDIIRGRRELTPDTALRLGRYFKTSPEFWLNLQMAHDLSVAETNGDYEKIEPFENAHAGHRR
jgi:addiction module HigA family antidote